MRKEPSLVAARHKPHAAVFNAGVLHWKPAVITQVMDMGEFISLWPKRKRPLIRQVWPVGLILMPRGLSGWAAVFTESILIIFHFYPHPSFQSCIKKLLGYAVLWSPDEHVKVKDHVFSQKLFGKSLSPKNCTILRQNGLSVTFHEEDWSLYPPQCTQTATSPWWGDKKGYWLFHSSLIFKESCLSAIPGRCSLWSPEAQEGDFPGRVDAL